jgi:hypothetical protein
VSREAIDLIDKLLQIKASERLGYQGASEVKVTIVLDIFSLHAVLGMYCVHAHLSSSWSNRNIRFLPTSTGIVCSR